MVKRYFISNMRFEKLFKSLILSKRFNFFDEKEQIQFKELWESWHDFLDSFNVLVFTYS